MNLDLPEHLHATRDLLTASMRIDPSDQAPAMPAALLEDLTRSVAIQPAAGRRGSFVGLFDSVRSMLSSPAFGAAAAAIMVLAVASTVVLRPDAPASGDTFRGSSSYATMESTRVILVGAPAGVLNELEATTDFEDGAISAVSSIKEPNSFSGSRVVVDFGAGTVTGIKASGEEVYHAMLPQSMGGLSLEIASALTRF